MATAIQVARAELRTKWRPNSFATFQLESGGTRQHLTTSRRQPSSVLTPQFRRRDESCTSHRWRGFREMQYVGSSVVMRRGRASVASVSSCFTSHRLQSSSLLGLSPSPTPSSQRHLSSSHPPSSSPPSPIPTPTPSSSPPEPPPSTPPTTKLRDQLKSLTSTPHENIYTLPNILTFSRLLCAPVIGYMVLHSHTTLALTLFFYAGVTDLVDGYLARRFNSTTVVGTVIDPMADKTLMTLCVAALGVTGQFPWWLVVIILGRDVALAISAIYFRWISLPPPKTMARYWDFSLPSAEVRPTEISKINTMLQLLLVGNAMVLPVLPEVWVEGANLGGVLEGWEYLVAATTVWSGLSYVGNKDAVKILSREEGERKAEEMAQKIGGATKE